MTSFVRVKRKKQTIFLMCEQSDTIMSLKKKIQSINSIEPQCQRLLMEEKINCDDNKTIRECKIEEGGTVALVYADTSQETGWESVEIELSREGLRADTPP